MVIEAVITGAIILIAIHILYRKVKKIRQENVAAVKKVGLIKNVINENRIV